MKTTAQQSFVINNNGFAIVYAAIVGLVIAGGMYFVMKSFEAGKKVGVNEQYVFHANLLAHNLVEAGKHLILYENFFFLDDPFNFTKDRLETIKRLWGKGVGIVGTETEVAKACGGFDAKGNPLGTGTASVGSTQVPIFCPMLLRSNQITGLLLEKIIFEGMIANNLHNFKKEKAGHYKLTIPLFSISDKIDRLSNPQNSIIDLNANQHLLKGISDRGLIDTINLNFEFFTDSSGFKASDGVRQIKVSSNIIFSKKIANRNIKNESVFLLYPSVLRDFAISIIYPKVLESNKIALLHKNLVAANPKTLIRGRVLFNGDIDTSNLKELPIFKETVVITGKLTNQNLNQEQKTIFSQKFTKGLVTGMSMPRYLLSGNCSKTGVKIVNTNGLFCKSGSESRPFTMNDYQAASNKCTGSASSEIIYNDKVNYCVNEKITTSTCYQDCGCYIEKGVTKCENSAILGGVLINDRKITVNGTKGFISTVANSIDLNAGYIYGNVFAEKVNIGPSVKSLVAMESIQIGQDLGISSSDVLNSYTDLVAQYSAGLLVNLPQMPTIILMDDSFK